MTLKSPNPWLPELWSVPPVGMDSTLPNITFGILSFNRLDDLRRTLDCLTRAIQYPDIEIIVVDNASEDGSPMMVKNEFPAVQLVTLNHNMGVSARNIILDRARGEYIFFHDDDSFPATPATIYKIVCFMLKNKDVSALSTIVIQPHNNGVNETSGWDLFSSKNTSDGTFEGVYFHEAAGCLRKSTVSNIRFDEKNLFYAEGHDFSLRLYSYRKKMVLHPSFVVLHAKSSAGHMRSKFPFWKGSNMIKMLYKNFGAPFVWLLVSLYIIRRIIGFFLRPSTTKNYLMGIIDGVKNRKEYVLSKPKIAPHRYLSLIRWYLFFLRW